MNTPLTDIEREQLAITRHLLSMFIMKLDTLKMKSERSLDEIAHLVTSRISDTDESKVLKQTVKQLLKMMEEEGL